MATKRITLNELKNTIKKMVMEELSKNDFYKGNKIKIKIVKCDNPMFWYKEFVGQEFMAVPDDSNTKWNDGKEKLKIVPDNRINGVNYVNKEDVQTIQ
jgi:hypothetical protein